MKTTEEIREAGMVSPKKEVLMSTVITYQDLAIALRDVARYQSGLIQARQEVQSCRKRLAELKQSYAQYLSEEDYRGSDPTSLWDFPDDTVKGTDLL